MRRVVFRIRFGGTKCTNDVTSILIDDKGLNNDFTDIPGVC